MYVDDMADACVYIMSLPDAQFLPLLASDRNDGIAPVVNVGVGTDLSIAELARLVAATVGFRGEIDYDTTKPDGTPRKLMDSSRLHALGWSARTTLEDGLKRAYEDFLARHRGG
jgi:GDP-L-fucose synthase